MMHPPPSITVTLVVAGALVFPAASRETRVKVTVPLGVDDAGLNVKVHGLPNDISPAPLSAPLQVMCTPTTPTLSDALTAIVVVTA